MPMVMDWTLELDGSEVQRTELKDGQLWLRFSAALVRKGRGAAVEEGHVKDLELRFGHVTLAGLGPDWSLCMGALSDCTLNFNGALQRHIALPFEATGDVRAEFNFRSGTTLLLSATSVQCLLPEDPSFQTSYAC